MSQLLVVIAAAPVAAAVYAYFIYPLLLVVAAKLRDRNVAPREPAEWPSVTVTIPIYNAVGSISCTLDSLLSLDYPRAKLQLLVISDASSDGSDDIVKGYADRGVELLRLPERRGKTAAENAAVAVARGEIIVNIDGTVSVPAGSLRPLIRAFTDATVGVASGRDVSVASNAHDANGGESRYVGYEMWVRDLETRAGSIVGASGCFYAIRKCVHAVPLPSEFSWDFASVLAAREIGLRSVSVPDAVCLVPRTAALQTEIRRKVRTMARGISTLFFKRALMNPRRFGWFAVMLVSHKLARWIPYLLAPVAVVALALLARSGLVASLVLVALASGAALGALGIGYGARGPALKPVRIAAFIVAVFVAGFLAWVEAIRRTQMATWEPTPRASVYPR